MIQRVGVRIRIAHLPEHSQIGPQSDHRIEIVRVREWSSAQKVIHDQLDCDLPLSVWVLINGGRESSIQKIWSKLSEQVGRDNLDLARHAFDLNCPADWDTVDRTDVDAAKVLLVTQQLQRFFEYFLLLFVALDNSHDATASALHRKGSAKTIDLNFVLFGGKHAGKDGDPGARRNDFRHQFGGYAAIHVWIDADGGRTASRRIITGNADHPNVPFSLRLLDQRRHALGAPRSNNQGVDFAVEQRIDCVGSGRTELLNRPINHFEAYMPIPLCFSGKPGVDLIVEISDLARNAETDAKRGTRKRKRTGREVRRIPVFAGELQYPISSPLAYPCPAIESAVHGANRNLRQSCQVSDPKVLGPVVCGFRPVLVRSVSSHFELSSDGWLDQVLIHSGYIF